MRLRYVGVYVRDVAAALAFYESAFGLARQHLNTEENGAYGELATGETTLAFASRQLVERHLPVPFTPHDPAAPPAGVELMFETADLEGTIDRAVTLGATIIAPPEDKPWGQRLAFLRDPEGVLLAVADPPSA